MVYVKTTFFPYRLILNRKQPVQLTIDIRNDEGKEKHFAMEVDVPRALGLDSTGPRSSDYKNLGALAAGQEKRFYYDIHGKAASEDTEYPVVVKVHEIVPGSRDILKTTTARAELTVQGK